MNLTMSLCVRILLDGLHTLPHRQSTEEAARTLSQLRAQLSAILQFYGDEDYRNHCLLYREALSDDYESVSFDFTSRGEVTMLCNQLLAHELEHDPIKEAMADALETLFA